MSTSGSRFIPWIATFLLTGGRRLEVLGLEAGDVSFDRKTVTFRPNGWRRLKTRTSHRVVPLWPQLEQILREYVDPLGRDEPLGELLFPSPKLSGELMITDTRKALDAIAKRAQELWLERERERLGDEAELNPAFQPGHVRTRIFRHTYCAARLQTVDNGAPVSPFTVAKEMGHGGTALVERVYGHLGTIRHRAEVMEYRVEGWVELSEQPPAARARR